MEPVAVADGVHVPVQTPDGGSPRPREARPEPSRLVVLGPAR